MSKSHRMVSEPSAQADVSDPPSQAAQVPDSELSWTLPALVAGTVGALVVAIVFLFADIVSGRPALWTPAVLGAALFMGDAIAESGPVRPETIWPVVFGYTLMHGTVFISLSAIVASSWLTRERCRHFTTRVAAFTALMVFVGLELTFLALGWFVGPTLDLAAQLGSGSIAIANALAAVAMTATISRAASDLAAHLD